MNGTTGYILTQMSRSSNLPYAQALAEAQARGFAEADPTLDVEGVDAAHKLAILTSLAYGTRIDFGAVGYRHQRHRPRGPAVRPGVRLRPSSFWPSPGRTADRLEARVAPHPDPRDHMLAGVGGAMNAVYITGDAVGPPAPGRRREPA